MQHPDFLINRVPSKPSQRHALPECQAAPARRRKLQATKHDGCQEFATAKRPGSSNSSREE